MQYKVKAMLGFYQCIAAVPGIFKLETPADFEHYKVWVSILEFPVHIGLEVVLPGSCLGRYLHRLLLASFWPIALVLVVGASLAGRGQKTKPRRALTDSGR